MAGSETAPHSMLTRGAQRGPRGPRTRAMNVTLLPIEAVGGSSKNETTSSAGSRGAATNSSGAEKVHSATRLNAATAPNSTAFRCNKVQAFMDTLNGIVVRNPPYVHPKVTMAERRAVVVQRRAEEEDRKRKELFEQLKHNTLRNPAIINANFLDQSPESVLEDLDAIDAADESLRTSFQRSVSETIGHQADSMASLGNQRQQ
ncbi:unnamed protein product, partial [Amoebophrya sp. A120]|eukprot:GSA120T00008446001.1